MLLRQKGFVVDRRMNEIADIYNRHPSPMCLHLTVDDVKDGQLFWEQTLKVMAPDMAGKKVLCLASGGGQQSMVFGLLGADVTVADLSDVQLEQDRQAAREKGYEVTCHNCSMEDLSMFSDGTFDLVYQAISICFCKDPLIVYQEVARVLKSGGLYRVEHVNPQIHDAESESWNGKGYLIEKEIYGPEDDAELEHTFTMAQMFNGLVASGLEILEVTDNPESLESASVYQPGSDEHFDRFVLNSFSILCRKE